MSFPDQINNASTIIGFVSFAASVATLIRVTWTELSTLVSAPAQVHFTLSNLKEALWEERVALRRVSRYTRKSSRHRRRSGSSAKATRAFTDKDITDDPANDLDVSIYRESVQELCKQFSDIEKPYLRSNLVDGTGQSGWDDIETATRYGEDRFRNDYGDMNLILRLNWLKARGAVDDIWTALSRLQQRRALVEITIALWEVEGMRKEMRALKLIPNPADDTDSDREGDGRVHVRRSSRRNR